MASQYDLPYTGVQVETLLGKVSELEAEMPTKTSDLENDSGFITQSAVPTKVSDLQNDSGFITNAPVVTEQQRAQGVEQGLAQRLTTVEGKIPSQASNQNQLADKDFVNSSIATSAANYISYNGQPFPSVEDLIAYTGPHDNNDYAFVVGVDGAGNTKYTRYKFNGTSWAAEYVLNNSSFTSAQWAAINSLITEALVTKLSYLPTNAQLTILFAGKQDVINDLTTIRSQAAAAYVKPGTGIPKTDLASGVQTSLDKADSALQSHQDISGKADKDTDAVAGNIAVFDASGNPVDSRASVREIGEINWREDKVSPVTYVSGNISKTDGSVVTSTAWEHAVIQLGNAKRVRFMGNVYQNVSSWAGGYAFYDENGDTIVAYTFDSAAENSPKEYVVIVPSGAKTFKTPVYIGTASYNVTREEDFYCYLQVGDTIADSLLSPITKFDLIGAGNTIVKKDLPDLVGGHRYRLYINEWDITDIYTSGNYSLLYVYAAYIQTYLFHEYVNASASRLPYYDFIVPADYSGKVVIGIRAAVSSIVKFRLEDITVAYAEIKERKQADYEKGLTVTYDFNDLIEYERVYANKWIYSRSSSLYNDVSPSASTLYPINVKIPLPAGIKYIKYTTFPTSNEWGSVVLDENDKVVDVYNNSGSSYDVTALYVPSSAKFFIYAIDRNMRKSVTLELSKYADDDRIDFLTERLKTAKVITGETTTLYRNTSDFSVLFEKYNYGQYYAAGASMGQNIADVIFYQSRSYSNYLIPVEWWKQVGIRQYKSTQQYGSLFLNANMVVVGGVYNTSDNRDVVVNVPTGAKWLLYSAASYNDDYVTFYAGDTMESTIEQLDTRIDDLAESSSSILQRTGAAPRYRSGIITAQGGITENAKYITTEPIFGNFALGVADGFLIFSGTLVDRNGNVVSHEHILPMSDITEEQTSWSARLTFSSLNMPAEYGYRLVICKADGTDITDDDTIITTFIAMGDAPVKRWIPDGLANYDVAQRRIEYMQRLLWTPLLKVPDGSDSSYATNTYFCLPGHLMTNVPYSDLGLTRKFVPANVSIRTFLTAAKNKRSLLYTENLFNGTSGYGLSYTGASRCGSYYGCACNAFTAWVMGLKTLYLSGDYNSNDVPGLSTVSNPSADNVQPLDLIWNQGHISIISDVFKDDYGKVKFVVWAEMTTPYAKRTIYTAEQFEARLTDRSCTVHRWNGWSGITEPPTVPGYNLHQIGGADCDVPYCEDIMCFAGDYASFASGEKVFLNARRGETYTGVELYKDDVLLDTIDITELAVDGSDGEDWVRVDLGTSLAAGKYKARLTDGTNTTGYTFFEVIGITLSATLGSGNITVSFSATGGTPVSLEGCASNGFAYYFHPITSEDIQAGSVTKSWASTSNNAKLYLLVQGDYGTVCKIINYPTA